MYIPCPATPPLIVLPPPWRAVAGLAVDPHRPTDHPPLFTMCGLLRGTAIFIKTHRTELIEFPLRNPTIKSANKANKKVKRFSMN